MKKVRCIGLDVHADTIAVAVAEPDGDVRSMGVIPNRPESIRKVVKKLGPAAHLRVCYEAGPTGYVIYWQLTGLGVHCDVVAPTLVPVKAGDRVKTDRRDATKLARSYRAGDLTAVWVPDAAHEALRDLVRAREAAKKDQLRARHRLGKFLLRHGRRPATAMTPWTQRHVTWIRQLQFEQPAQTLVRGFYDDINRGDVAAFMAKLADDFVEHEALPGVPPTKQGVGMLFEQLRKAFSGFRMHVEAIAAEGDMVMVRGTMAGTHVGEFMGVPPSGKEVRVPFCDWTGVRNGKAVEHWGVTDTSALMA